MPESPAPNALAIWQAKPSGKINENNVAIAHNHTCPHGDDSGEKRSDDKDNKDEVRHLVLPRSTQSMSIDRRR